MHPFFRGKTWCCFSVVKSYTIIQSPILKHKKHCNFKGFALQSSVYNVSMEHEGEEKTPKKTTQEDSYFSRKIEGKRGEKQWRVNPEKLMK